MIEIHQPTPWIRCSLDQGGVAQVLASMRPLPETGGTAAEDHAALAGLLDAWTSAAGAHGGQVTARCLSGPMPGWDVTVTASHPVAWPGHPSIPGHRSDRWAGAQGSAAWVRVGGTDRRLGVAQHAYRDEPFSGDAWAVACDASAMTAMIVDGLGHGPLAAIAAGEAIDAFLTDPLAAPEVSLRRLHAQLGPTCGGVGAVARFDRASQAVAFTGAGDISGRLLDRDRSKGMAPSAGILGRRLTAVRTFTYTATGSLLILHTDGIAQRWGFPTLPAFVSSTRR